MKKTLETVWLADHPMLANAHFFRQRTMSVLMGQPGRMLIGAWEITVSLSEKSAPLPKVHLYHVRRHRFLDSEALIKDQGIEEDDVFVLLQGEKKEVDILAAIVAQNRDFPKQLPHGIPSHLERLTYEKLIEEFNKKERPSTPEQPEPLGSMNPFQLLREASRRFPRLSYAWALVGVAAASAIIASLFKKPQFAVPVIVFAIAGMFLLALFAKWVSSREAGNTVSFPTQVLVWVCVLAFSYVLFAVLGAASVGKPNYLAKLLFPNTIPTESGESPTPPKAVELRYIQLQFGDFKYGIDSYHIGAPIRLNTRVFDARGTPVVALVNQFPVNDTCNPQFENPSPTPKTFKAEKIVIFQMPSSEKEFKIDLELDVFGFNQKSRSSEELPVSHLTNSLVVKTIRNDWNLGRYAFKKLTPTLRVGGDEGFKPVAKWLPFVDGELDFTVHEITLAQSQTAERITR